MKAFVRSVCLVLMFVLMSQTTLAVSLTPREVVQYERKVKALNRTLNSGRVRDRHESYYRNEMVRLMNLLDQHDREQQEQKLSRIEIARKRRSELSAKREARVKQEKIEAQKKAAEEEYYKARIADMLKKNTGRVTRKDIAKRLAVIQKQQEKKAFEQEGIASYYSDIFNNRTTASGIKFHNDQLMIAHRELSFGTQVRVINLDNGKEVKNAIVVDRGPYAKVIDPETGRRVVDTSRVADLSKALFKLLSDDHNMDGEGDLSMGLIRVRLEVE
jgi:rare lipoprotein A (peptidoglycan hydrolase)